MLPSTGFTVYEAAEGFFAELLAELPEPLEARPPLVLVHGPARPAAWACNVWLEPRFMAAPSIGEAAKALRALQRNWALTPTALHRRAALIQERLPRLPARPHAFGDPLPAAPMGAWTLWDENTILASASCSSPFASGRVGFAEDKVQPPNRAYLKLWELFTRMRLHPVPGELCLDLGASPGGWTWVLAGLRARVFAIDKAPLARHIAELPNVEHCRGSAFGLDPRHAGAVDWLFCDVICYPDRLLATVRRWLELGQCRNFACTVKFQAQTDFAAMAGFAAIPGSRLVHLCHNKHELTWILLSPDKTASLPEFL